MKNHKCRMKTKMAIGLLTGLFVFGTAQITVSQTTFESTKKSALDLYASLISLATPQVRDKISAAATAFQTFLAQCAPNCDLYQFSVNDLKRRFPSLTEMQLQLLITLVFAQVVRALTPQMDLQLSAAYHTESRIYTTISNILKTKLDTLKATISNIR